LLRIQLQGEINMLIPHVEITDQRKRELQVLVADSNIIFKKYYKQVVVNKGSRGFVTTSNKRLSRINFFNEIVSSYKKNPKGDVCLYGIVIPHLEASSIVQVENFREEILGSMSKMFSKIANKKLRTTKDRAISYEDLESEALKCAISSICSYANSAVCFTTYFYHCVNRHINNYCNRSNPMSKLSKKAISLKKRFAEAKRDCQDCSNLDGIIETMNLKQKDVLILKAALSCSTAVDEKSITEKVCCDISGSKTYSMKNNILIESLEDVSLDSLNSIEMSQLEKAVLDGFLQSAKGMGLNSISKNIINPKTGKPFTRMAASLAWKRVKEKIKNYRKAA